MSGRRRQGKTFLLRALCQATGGFYFAADEAADRESLRRIGMVLADHLGAPAPLAFESWHVAVDALLALGRDRRIPVVIDEFPYLARANPQLPSIIQNALAPLRPERDSSRTSLLLCGSTMSFMGRLLGGNAPLRGRAGLELVVPTLDHQLAAEFWGVEDPITALKVNAIVGGSPRTAGNSPATLPPRAPTTLIPGCCVRCCRLLVAQGRYGAERARLVCFSGAGFTEELVAEAGRDGAVALVDPARLYQRD